MIDCKLAENYLKEKARMTKDCTIGCNICPLKYTNIKHASINDKDLDCSMIEQKYPQKAIAIVQEWSNTHPKKTYLNDFLEKHPKAILAPNGTPANLCPGMFGYCAIVNCGQYEPNCVACWNRPLEE